MNEDAPRSRSFFGELRRRNVFKVATVYLIASWFLIQVAETVFPVLQLPDWTVTFIVVVLAILFPIAVIFAWAFELTPEGLKRSTEVDPGESITPRTGQKINYAIIGVLVAAIAFLVFARGSFFGGIGPTGDRAGESGPAATQSIAVLPFVNMSDDKDNEFFSDGLSEELLNVLAQVDGLRVAARTSSFHFKGTNEDLRSVASKLGVDHVLEGSVRKSGNRIRVTAQLIKANDGFHIWSDTYDYEVDDIFRIQDEISLAVVDALKVSLLGEDRQRLTKRATTNLEAHNLYLRGRQFLHLRTQESVQQARRLFQDAVRMDPGYALAYSGLADSIQLLSNNHSLISPEDAEAESRPLLERAVALDPDSAEVWASTGLMEAHSGNPEAARVALEKAILLNPSYATGYLWLASVRSAPPFDDEEGALVLYRKVLDIDPLSRVAQNNVAATLMDLGRYDEAEAEFRRAITLDPDYPTPYAGMANLNNNIYHRLDEAHRWYLKANELAPLDVSVAVNLPFLYRTLGMGEEFDRWARRIENDAPEHPIATVIPVWRAALTLNADTLIAQLDEAEREGHALPFVLRQLRCLALQLDGRSGQAIPMVKEHAPELFVNPAQVNDNNNGDAFCAIRALLAAGDTGQAKIMTDGWRKYAETSILEPGNRHMSLARLAVINRDYETAIAEARLAVDAGWVGSFGWGWTLVEDPDWAPVADRPEVMALAARLDKKIATQRAAVEAQLEELGAGLKF
jgi:TolB-like protein